MTQSFRKIRQQQKSTKLPRLNDITKATALAEIRRYKDLFPDSPPEVSAMGLMRQIDSWEEFTAILSALDQSLRED